MSNSENRGSKSPASSTRIGNGKSNTPPPSSPNNRPVLSQGGTKGKVNTPPVQAPKPSTK